MEGAVILKTQLRLHHSGEIKDESEFHPHSCFPLKINQILLFPMVKTTVNCFSRLTACVAPPRLVYSFTSTCPIFWRLPK